MTEREATFSAFPWRCRCTEPAPDRIGTIRIRRPADQSDCHVCGFTKAEAHEEESQNQINWLDYMEQVEQEVFPDSRPRSEVIVEIDGD